MNDPIVVNLTISMDASHMGANSVYGTYELRKILECGAEKLKYDIVIAEDAKEVITVNCKHYIIPRLIVTIKPKG